MTLLVNPGYAGGTSYYNKGGGVNYQCMPYDPQYSRTYKDNGGTGVWYGAWITGVEYQTSKYGIFPDSAENQNAPCARCYTNNRPAVMTIPAKRDCPDSWKKEYEGKCNRTEPRFNFFSQRLLGFNQID